MKKAQGLSLNTIIIAALVIMVLVILALVFTGQMGIFGSSTKSCSSKGGTCKESCNSDTETLSILGGDCEGELKCCMPKVA